MPKPVSPSRSKRSPHQQRGCVKIKKAAKPHPMVIAVRMVGELLNHHPTSWALARARNNKPVDPLSKSACHWCLLGAISAVCATLNIDEGDLYFTILNVLKYQSVPTDRDRWKNGGIVGGWDDGGDTVRHRASARLSKVRSL